MSYGQPSWFHMYKRESASGVYTVVAERQISIFLASSQTVAYPLSRFDTHPRLDLKHLKPREPAIVQSARFQ